MAVVEALIGAGASLLGGLFGRKKEKSAEQNSREGILGQARGAREAAEKYGFNPLTLLGVSSPLGPSQSANYLGSAIADAGMILADGLARKKEATQLTKLEQENAKLKEKLQQETLRPDVGGVYAKRVQTPTLRQAVGGDESAQRPNHDHPLRHGLGDIATPDSTLDRGSGLFIGGYRLEGAPGWSSGEAFEQEYGDTPLSWPYSGAKMVADAAHNIGRAATNAEVNAAAARGGKPFRASDGKYYVRQPDPVIDGGIYLYPPDVPPKSRPDRRRTYRPPSVRGPDGNFR